MLTSLYQKLSSVIKRNPVGHEIKKFIIIDCPNTFWMVNSNNFSVSFFAKHR